jgi:hypothetical protein
MPEPSVASPPNHNQVGPLNLCYPPQPTAGGVITGSAHDLGPRGSELPGKGNRVICTLMAVAADKNLNEHDVCSDLK